jgi:hypothetical protein
MFFPPPLASISKSFSVSAVSNVAQSPINILVLSQAQCQTMTFSLSIWRVDLDCLQPITSRPRQTLASARTLWGIIENMSHATLERSVYFQCVSSFWGHLSVISGNQNGLLISVGLGWKSFTFRFSCPQFVGHSGRKFK